MIKISEEKVNLINELLLTTDKNTTEIAFIVGVSRSPVNKQLSKLFTKQERIDRRNKMLSISNTGEGNPNFGNKQGKKHLNEEGYIMVSKPSWFTGRKSSRSVFEHHVILCEFLGITQIPDGCCVHHNDLDKTNNALENLTIMTFSEHTALHKCLEREISI